MSPHLHPREVESQLYRIRTRATRIIAWLLFLSKILSLSTALLTKTTAPDLRAAFLWIRVPDLLLNFLIVLAIQFSSPVPAILRLLLLYSVTVLVTVESSVVQPLSGWAFSWVNFAAAMGSITFFDAVNERRYGEIVIIGNFILSVVGIMLHPFISFIPPNPIAHGLPRFVLITLAVGAGGWIVFKHYAKLIESAVGFASELESVMEAREKMTEEALRQKELAERRQQEVESALAELSRLREVERRRAEQERFLIRYEKLMRESYGIAPKDFLQKLLDTLGNDLPLLGALLYMRKGESWRVDAAYAFPSEIGRILKSGILQMAAELRMPHLVHPAPDGIKRPLAALHSPKPAAVLYLPLLNEATQEVIAVIELLLAKLPSEESLSLLQEVASRLGTYIGMRMQAETISSSN